MHLHHIFFKLAIMLCSIILLSGCAPQMEFPDYSPSGTLYISSTVSTHPEVPSTNSLADTREGEVYIPSVLPETASLMSTDWIIWFNNGTTDDSKKLLSLFPQSKTNFDQSNQLISFIFNKPIAIDTLPISATPYDFSSHFGPACALVNLAVSASLETTAMMQSIFGKADASNMMQGILTRVNLGDSTLLAYSPAKDQPFTKMAIHRRLSANQAKSTFIKCTDLNKIASPLSLTEPVIIIKNTWEFWMFQLNKTTLSNGTTPYMTVYVPVLSDGRGFYPNRTEWLFTADTNLFVLSYLLDGNPDEDCSFVINEKSYPVFDKLQPTISDNGILLKDKLTGEGYEIPLPSLVFKNLKALQLLFDLPNLFRIEPANDPLQSAQNIYRLQLLFGWDFPTYGASVESSYTDIATITTNIADGTLKSIKIQPKFTVDQAQDKRYQRVEDCGIGSLRLGMSARQLLAVASNQKDAEALLMMESAIKGTLDEMNALPTLQNIQYLYSPTVDMLKYMSYTGSEENLITTQGIGIGATKPDVLAAYGAPDVGLETDNTWSYMTYLADAPEDETIYNTNYIRFVFENGAVSAIEMLANVGL